MGTVWVLFAGLGLEDPDCFVIMTEAVPHDAEDDPRRQRARIELKGLQGERQRLFRAPSNIWIAGHIQPREDLQWRWVPGRQF